MKDIEKLDNGGTGRPALSTKTEKDCEDGFDNECKRKITFCLFAPVVYFSASTTFKFRDFNF